MTPEDLRSAVRALVGDVVVLGAFEVRQPGPGDSTIRSIVAWSDGEAFVLDASAWRAKPVELVGRMPLVAALLPEVDGAQPWDPNRLVVGGAHYFVFDAHASESVRFRMAWREAVQAAAKGPARRTL